MKYQENLPRKYCLCGSKYWKDDGGLCLRCDYEIIREVKRIFEIDDDDIPMNFTYPAENPFHKREDEG